MKFNRNIPDPIRNLSLQRLNQQIENYANGYIADFTVTAEAMETRDDILLNVILKRKKAVARHPREIPMSDESAEARLHHDALRFFYDNLTCTHSLKEDAVGGVTLLVHQMMDAAAKGWAVHEITWQPVTHALPKHGRERFHPVPFVSGSAFHAAPIASPGKGRLPRRPSKRYLGSGGTDPYRVEGAGKVLKINRRVEEFKIQSQRHDDAAARKKQLDRLLTAKMSQGLRLRILAKGFI